MTAYVSDDLGVLSEYDPDADKIQQLSNRWSVAIKKCSRPFFDIFPKDLNLIQPPFLPNLKFSKFSLTGELICY